MAGGGYGNPLRYVFLSGEFHGQRSLADHSTWGSTELAMNEATQHAHAHTFWRYTQLQIMHFKLLGSLQLYNLSILLFTYLHPRQWAIMLFPYHLILVRVPVVIQSLSHVRVPAAAAAKSLQSCLTLCDPLDGSPPGSPVPGILQARTLEWVAISFSNA